MPSPSPPPSRRAKTSRGADRKADREADHNADSNADASADAAPPAASGGYVELHCLSNFSFLRGASHPEELVERALALGYAGLALTDECSFAGSVRAHLALREAQERLPAARHFRLLHGTELQLADGTHLVLLATDREGYGNLSELVSAARRAAPKGSYHIDRAGLQARAQQGLLTGVLALLVAPPGLTGEAGPVQDTLLAAAQWLAGLLPGRAWLACALLRGPDDAGRLARVAAIARASGLAPVAVGSVLMHRRTRKPLQDALTAIRLRTPLARCGSLLQANAERSLRLPARLAARFPPDWVARSAAIAARCRFGLEELRYEYPEELVPPGATPASHLRALTLAGAAARYPQGVPAAVQALLGHELELVSELRFEPYFLTVHDVVRFARSRGILCQGRGSAANSAVCYCLGITEVDPARMSVLFERFISRERNEPPDIDVDFEHERREEVMQYLFSRYGRERAALAAAVHTYRPRGAVRDLGKALGLAPDQVERLARAMAGWDGGQIDPQRLADAGLAPQAPLPARLLALANELIGFPRHLSQHSGGFVIARTRLDRLVPIENAAMADRTVIQWDKDDLDALGLLKVDVLALGMLSCIRRALGHLAGQAAGPAAPLTLASIPAEDPAVYAMLSRGDSLGVFQVESRAQMNMLPRLRPRCFYDLVIQTAIVRPGPIMGGMVHPYLRRRQGLEPVDYPSAAVRGVLERTLGVSIFQEQVMALAVVAAGFTPGEADGLRRAMAAWKRKGGIGPFRERLVAGMLARGYRAAWAEQVYRQIEGFGEYGFPESHAASFALLVYASAWLKCHHPAAFCAALLDAQPLGFYAPAQIVRDARAHGVEVRPVCVQHSGWDCHLEPALEPSPEPGAKPGVQTRAGRGPSDLQTGAEAAAGNGPALRLGLKQVQGLSQEIAQRLLAARTDGPFATVADLARRAGLGRPELARLAAADALAALGGHRRQALWAALGSDAGALRHAPLAACAPEDPAALAAPAEGEEIVADYRSLGLSLRRHPLALLRPALAARRLVDSAWIASARHRQLVRTCGLVTCRQRPATASGVTFVTLEDEHGAMNVVVWRAVAERFRRELLGATLLTVYGHVERLDTPASAVLHVIAARLVDHSALLGGLQVRSHDFH